MDRLLHASFTLERQFDASPQRVFACYADPKEKLAWLACHVDWRYKIFEFHPGGRELGGNHPTDGGPVYEFDGVYQDIIPNRRILYTYGMSRDGVRFSASVSAIELEPFNGGTKLIFTEHSSFIDGPDTPALREEGTAWGLDQLRLYVEREKARA